MYFDVPVYSHTKSHQIPFQECWSFYVIHEILNDTYDQNQVFAEW